MDLIGPFLTNCMFVTGKPSKVKHLSPNVEHIILHCSKYEKVPQLLKLAAKNEGKSILVFTNSLGNAYFVAAMLIEARSKQVGVMEWQRPPRRHDHHRASAEFNIGRLCALVAPSVALRRLDIQNVDIVLNYDLPKSIDQYITRVGWTGRVVGNKGIAVSFYDPVQDSALSAALVRILREADQTVPDFLGGGQARVTVAQDQEFDEDYFYLPPGN